MSWTVAVLAAMLAAMSSSAAGAQTMTLTEPSAPLLPASFGAWKQAPSAGPIGDYTLTTISKQALEECHPVRSQVSDYLHDGRSLHVEAVQFDDRTGAYSAYTLVRQPGMHEARDLGSWDATSDHAILFTVSSTVVLVTGASAADVAALKPLSLVMPKIPGNKGVAPLLPELVPTKGRINGTLRYATGPASYLAEGGVLPANQIGFDKAGEAAMALYGDKAHPETLTVLLYPTPTIAARITQALQNSFAQMGSSFQHAKVRRDAEAVAVASGNLTDAQALSLVGQVHLRQEVAIDPDVEPTIPMKIRQTYSLLTSIAVLAGVLMSAAVLMGLFLGGGRALYRVARGKSAAADVEFLALNLAPQNKPVRFGPDE
jgi:hypothetical protein